MGRPGTWVSVTVKVAQQKNNEVEGWVPPSASDVATEIRTRMEDVDLDTGWTIASVSS